MSGRNFPPQLFTTGSSMYMGDGGTGLLDDGSGNDNVGIGTNVLTAMVTAAGNVAIGNQAMKSRTAGSQTIAIGISAGGIGGGDVGDKNVLIGSSAGYALDGSGGTYNASSNVYIGYHSGILATAGLKNTAVGDNSGKDLVGGSSNTFLGYYAGNGGNTEGGTFLGQYTTTAGGTTNETAIGNSTVGKGSHTVVLGDDRVTDIYLSEDIGATVHTGTVSGSAISTGSFGSVMQNGKHFPQVNAVGESFGFGTNAGSANIAGNQFQINIAIGFNAGTAMAAKGGNVFIGTNAAKLRTTGDDNVVIGTSAGGASSSDFGDKNVFIGLNTGVAVNSTGADANVMIGNLAGTAVTSGAANVLIGSDAGKTFTSAGNNVAIGVQAGTGFGVTPTTTQNSVYIGQFARTSVTNANHEVVIGSEASGHGSNTITIGSIRHTDVHFASGSATGIRVHNIKEFVGNISGSSTSTGSFGAIQSAGNITPKVDDTSNLGSAALRFSNVFTTDLQLSNEGKPEGNEVDGTTGSWTIQEGEDNLYLLNRKNGKRYKFKLQEVE